MSVPRLLLLTDAAQLPPGRDLVATIAACVDAGLTHVVLRELDQPNGRRAELAADLARLRGLTVIAARGPLPGAAGVHLAAHQDRSAAGPEAGLVGRSCHSASEVEQAAAAGLDYVTLSPFAATASKPGYGPPVDRRAYAGHTVPVLALGGLTPDLVGDALAAGAHGVAVMGAVMRAHDPGAVVHDLLTRLTPTSTGATA